MMYVDPSGHFAISTFLIGFAASSLVTWGLSEFFGAQIVGGASSILNGVGAIKTEASLCLLGPWSIVAGITLITIGGLTIALGANEVVAGISGTNYIRDTIGHGLYDGLNIGLNVVSSVGTIAGNLYMSHIRASALRGLEDATYGPKASKHIGERLYYDSILTQREIVKYGQIKRAKYGVPGFDFRINGSTIMGKSGNLHMGT